MKRLLFSALILGLFLFPHTVEAQVLTDLDDYEWQYSVEYLVEGGIVQGYQDGTYRPDASINRAELTKIVVETFYFPEDIQAADASCFPDVKRGEWYAPYVCLALDEGIVSGHADGFFRPGDLVNQAEALKIILEAFYFGIPDAEGEWYQKYLEEAEFMGMFYFDKENAASHQLTRGEMAYFMTWNLDIFSPDQIDYEGFFPEGFAFEDFYWEPLTAEDCFEDEYYDSQDQMCYLRYEELDGFAGDDYYDAFEAQFGNLFDELYEGEYDLSFGQESFNADGPETLVRYSVDGDSITFLENVGSIDPLLQDTEKHQQIWEAFTNLVPRSHRQDLFFEYQVFTDGRDGIMAYVAQDENDLSQWLIGVDVADSFEPSGQLDTGEFLVTLAHEYAHVMTLQQNQVDAVSLPDDSEEAYLQAEQACRPRFFVAEGCAKTDSFLNQFFKRFWGGEVYQDWKKLPLTEQGLPSEDDVFRFYEDHPGVFITEYAATSVEEDIAESFAYFVFKEQPTGSAIQDQKIGFFYEYPSLVTLRKAMRQSLGKVL